MMRRGLVRRMRSRCGQAVDILAMNFDQHQPVRCFTAAIDFFMHRFDQAGLAHAARAPQQRIVGGKAGGEMPCVGQQGVTLVLHAFQQAQIDMGDMRHGDQPALRRLPDKGVALGQLAGDGSRRQPLQRIGDARKQGRVFQSP